MLLHWFTNVSQNLQQWAAMHLPVPINVLSNLFKNFDTDVHKIKKTDQL